MTLTEALEAAVPHFERLQFGLAFQHLEAREDLLLEEVSAGRHSDMPFIAGQPIQLLGIAPNRSVEIAVSASDGRTRVTRMLYVHENGRAEFANDVSIGRVDFR